eukprot:GHVS01052886.1.p2 GENE.GHVS01052886.1~~GHVS01052886.1.p2  ORF type:complete len:128 (+),score=10.41 GHVS01052886.1:157-540(+)
MSEEINVCNILPPRTKAESTALIVCGILNLVAPGIGESITGCVTNRYTDLTWRGLAQLLLIFLMITAPIGVIWAWVDGVVMIIQGVGFSESAESLRTVVVVQQADGEYAVEPTAPPSSSDTGRYYEC